MAQKLSYKEMGVVALLKRALLQVEWEFNHINGHI